MYIHISLQRIRERKAMTGKISYIQITLHQLQRIAEFWTSVWCFHVAQSKVNAILSTSFWPMKYCSMLSKMSHSLNRMQLVWFVKKSILSRLKICIFKDRYNCHLPQYRLKSKLFQLLRDQVCLFFPPVFLLCLSRALFPSIDSTSCSCTSRWTSSLIFLMGSP